MKDGDWRLEIGDWVLEIRDWGLEIRDQRLEEDYEKTVGSIDGSHC
jgi:hypothetical protein